MAPRIVYFGLADWHAPRQRPQHLAGELSRRCRVLYVRAQPLSRLVRDRRALPRVERPSADLLVLRPPALSPGRLPTVARLNDYLTTRVVRRHLGPTGPVILWLSHPDQASQIGRYGEALVCFDSMDYHAAFKRGRARATMATAERDLLARADLVFTSSEDLHGRARAVGARAMLVSNAADVEHFARAAGPLPEPTDLARCRRPRLLYYGTLGPWVDAGWIAGIARARPDWSVVLIGPRAGADLRPLAGSPNVCLLGPRPYAALPAYLRHADVCLLPRLANDLTRAMDPVKVYEYLAAGRPVVATPLPELAKYGDLVDVAATPAAAVAAIERHLLTPDDERRRARRAFAAGHTWPARGAAVSAALEAALAGRVGGSTAGA